jgi:hypothetical protein
MPWNQDANITYNINRAAAEKQPSGPLQDPSSRESSNPYPNGGRFLPYVGNSWWQTSEPILPWNRKDWRKPGDRWYNTGK